MRKYLKLSEVGLVGNLIELLENRGVLVYMCDIDQGAFFGMNGSVNGRPYIIVCGIISDHAAKEIYIKAGQAGWRKNEPSLIEREEPLLFMQLVFRAVAEKEISIQKGAEILQKSYSYVASQCFADWW